MFLYTSSLQFLKERYSDKSCFHINVLAWMTVHLAKLNLWISYINDSRFKIDQQTRHISSISLDLCRTCRAMVSSFSFSICNVCCSCSTFERSFANLSRSIRRSSTCFAKRTFSSVMTCTELSNSAPVYKMEE